MEILFAFLVIISLSQHSSAQPLSIEQWKHRFLPSQVDISSYSDA
jgi:hypothetical protein